MSDATILIGTRVSPDVRDALAKLARRRERSIAGELRAALANHMREAAAEQRETEEVSSG